MTEHKVIFLDIDGVLNSAAWHWEQKHRDSFIEGPRVHFDPAAVARLNRLTDTTGATIVLSSSWRQFGEDYMRETLASVGVTVEMIGVTPILDDGSRIMRPVDRGQEILAWMLEHGEPEQYVVLDDNDDMDGVRHRFVRTSHDVGLTDADVDRAIKMLGGAA